MKIEERVVLLVLRGSMDLSSKKLFLFDIDGVIRLGGKPIDGAVDVLRFLRAHNKKLCFLTNNSSKSKMDYMKMFEEFNFPIASTEIVTSGMAAARFLSKNRSGKTVYCLGTDSFKAELLQHGITLVKKNADIVIVGLDITFTYEKVSAACHMIDAGAEYLATHPDYLCPSENGNMPDCGSICALIEKTTGKHPAIFMGKPYETMAEFIHENFDIDAHNTVMIGDRLSTDILFGKNNKIDTIAVLTGETSRQEIESSNIKPDLVLNSVRDIPKLMKVGFKPI